MLDHVGRPVGVPEFATRRDEVPRQWAPDPRAGPAPPVRVKVGGPGRPILGGGFDHSDRPAMLQALAQAWKPLMPVCSEAFGPTCCRLERNVPVDRQPCGHGPLWNACKCAMAGRSVGERKALFDASARRAGRLPGWQAEREAAWLTA